MHAKVTELTLEEKAELLSGASFWSTRDVPRAGLAAAVLTDGPHGVRLQREGGDHLGLFDSEPATSFPTASATGSSWDPELLQEMGRALGAESRALGVDILLGPGVNIKRSPLCGRNFEYFSEDPLLSGELGAGWVRGVQSVGVGASVKHFAANNQESDRLRVSAEVDERTLREIYLPAFERIVRAARPATVMCSYNRVNGVYASQNRWLLTEVLRDNWGFDGYVVSDWGAVVDPVAAVAAGLDLEMPTTGERSPQAIVAAVQRGELEESTIDQAVSRILSVHDRLREARAPMMPVDFDAHHELARRIAAESAVLLRNEGGILPLDEHSTGTLAVIGEFARTPRYQGAGSSHINPTRLDDALSSISARTGRAVEFAPGFTFDGSGDETALRAEAVALASRAETVVLFLGLPASEESEGFDREHMELPAAQIRLATEVCATSRDVVVVLSHGGVVALGDLIDDARALLEMWLSGQGGGSAIADILFGRAEPGGRLAETVPLALEHTPAHLNWPGENGRVVYGEGVHVGYRWYDATDRAVAFPFGFGLSYTEFEYSGIRVEIADPTVAAAVVEVTIANVGERDGSDVVQVYVADEDASVRRPARELKAFQKVRLAPGERRTLRFELDERAFAFWGDGDWVVEPGAFTIEVGASSRDPRQSARIELDVPVPIPTLDAGSTLGEWLAHPVGSTVVTEMLGQASDGAQALLHDGEAVRMLASMPLKTILGFGQGGVNTDALVEQLLTATHDAAASEVAR